MNRLCLGCGTSTTGTRCTRCARAETRRRTSVRDATAAAVYRSTAWRNLARATVAAVTSCHWCGRRGVRLSADHVLGVRARPDLALSPGNAVAACTSCQNRRRGDA